MYSSENLDRLSNYILAGVYMHSKDPHKTSTLESELSPKVLKDLPQNVKNGDQDGIEKTLKDIASALNISFKNLKLILNGNFLPVLRLMEKARKKVDDNETLLRYLQVVAHIDGKTLKSVAKALGRSEDYFVKTVSSHDYQNKLNELCKSAGMFGVSVKAMADAVSRSRIRNKKPKKRAKPNPKKPLKVTISPKAHKLIQRHDEGTVFRDAWNAFMKMFKSRKLRITKTAKTAHIIDGKIDVGTLGWISREDAEKKVRKIYPEEPPKGLLMTRPKYFNERETVFQDIGEAPSKENKFLFVKEYYHIKLNNGYLITLDFYTFIHTLPGDRTVTRTSALPYYHKELSVKKRRLLKKFNQN